MVVDPSRDPWPYLRAAEARGLAIAWVVETHLHADFVSGARELGTAGAGLLAPRAATLGFPHRGLDDGDEVDLGGLTLRALATPGHTPEHLAYLLLDGGRPLAVFTGGALLPGSVARTDLIAPDRTEALARALFRAIRERLLTLPDDVAVYPTHGPGSFCSAPADRERITTIGRERATNPLLAAPDEDAFVRALLASLGSYPPYFLRLREVNRRGPRVLGSRPPGLRPLGPAEVRRLLAEGAELVDVRPIRDFARGHVPGALSIELRPSFPTWLGWLVPPDRPLVFALDPDQDRAELAWACLKVGYEDLAGELAGGMEGWRAAGLGERRLPVVAAERLGRARVLDVRQRSEFLEGHLPGAVHVELGSLEGAGDLPGGPLAVMCAHGQRATTAASLLERAGRTDVTVVVGGPGEWSAATGIALERSG